MILPMNTFCSLVVAAVAAAGLSGQDAVKATLSPVTEVLSVGQTAEFVLRVEVLEDTELSATVLSGMQLEVVVGDAAPAMIGRALDGTVKVAAGTVVERRLAVDVPAPAEAGTGLTRVGVTWPGISGATTSLRIAPDQSGIDVETLDLEKTQVLLVTNFGSMTVGFLPDDAPNHSKNFIKLAKSGFYDGTRFHRVMRGFMIQGGCPNTKEGATGTPGTGNPGYTIDREVSDVRHNRGVLSMARGPDPNSAGSQFFVLHGAAPWLDGEYSAFGKLAAGEDTLDKIADVPVTASPTGEASVPTVAVHLHRAIVLPVAK